MLPKSVSTEAFRPIAYVALDDPAIRARVVGILEDAGWTAVVEPTGFHLLQAIADIIDGSRPWLRPGLIVIDAFARGCAGTTIALGLRDLGITIPIVLAVAPWHPKPLEPSDCMLHVAGRDTVERVVGELVRSASTPAAELSCGPTSPSTSSSPTA